MIVALYHSDPKIKRTNSVFKKLKLRFDAIRSVRLGYILSCLSIRRLQPIYVAEHFFDLSGISLQLRRKRELIFHWKLAC